MTTENKTEGAPVGEPAFIVIDGNKYPNENPKTGRRVLELAQRHPVEDFLVFILDREQGMHDVGIDNHFHLEPHQITEFFTFLADRSYRFEVEGQRQDWGAPFVTRGHDPEDC
ncbi:MAG: hypothetical protein QM796_20365 [Chthoniobacteraceae bacterium]